MSRILYISDHHGRWQNFGYLDGVEHDRVYCLGDITGAEPDNSRKTIDCLQRLDATCVLGQHDRAVFDEEARSQYVKSAEEGILAQRNYINAMIALRLRNELGGDYVQWLAQWKDPVREDKLDDRYTALMVHDCLPGTRLSKKESIELGLGGLFKGRIVTSVHAKRNFEAPRAFSLLIHGHTHIPMIWENPESPSGIMVQKSDPAARLNKWKMYILCPGSMCDDSGLRIVPRCGFRTKGAKRVNSYGILDTKPGESEYIWTVQFHEE